jgi:hypothetical protein
MNVPRSAVAGTTIPRYAAPPDLPLMAEMQFGGFAAV